MGKQSRRKNKGAEDKQARKEKQRQIRQTGGLQGESDNHNNHEKLQEIDVGDRVRFVFDALDRVAWRWGVVKSIVKRSAAECDECLSYSILPWRASEDRELVEVQNLIVEVQNQIRSMAAVGNRIYTTVEKWQGLCTLRFAKGDKVFCRGEEGSGRDTSWRAATIDQLWPVWFVANNGSCCYQCIDDLNRHCIYVMSDTDDRIVGCEVKNLRFSKGQKVVFRRNPPPKQRDQWAKGEIIGTFVGGGKADDHCAGYSVRFYESGRPMSCHVSPDTDEFIARDDAGPRQRLFDAIEQDCSYSHLNHLVTTSKLDVSSFRDLILSKAIKSCSYNALGWLQDAMKVELFNIRDADGRGLFHQIAALPKADRFFEKAAHAMKKEPGYIAMNEFDYGYNKALITQVDRYGRSWLHQLVISGNIRALDIALSPTGRVAWDLASKLFYAFSSSSSNEAEPALLSFTQDGKGTSIRDAAKLLGRHDMVKMIDEYAKWQSLFELAMVIQQNDAKMDNIKATTLPRFGGISDATIARNLNGYLDRSRVLTQSGYLDEFKQRSLQDMIYFSIVPNGNVPILTWLVESDPTVLDFSNSRDWRVSTETNVNEFAQPELFDDAMEKVPKGEQLELVSLAAHGRCYRPSSFTTDARKAYASMQCSSILPSSGGNDVAANIKDILEKGCPFGTLNAVESLLRYKLRLLCDDESLGPRVEMLNYLVKEKGLPPPNVLDIIRWRQCGVLRWMISESLVDLNTAASDDPQTVRNANKVNFLGGQSLPLSLSVGAFLSFAAVEYDDLQSFAWLVDQIGVSVSLMRCDGWNLLHACAHFGRVEIAFWILRHVTQSQGSAVAEQFVSEPCEREGQRDLFAAHLAVQRGYIQLTDFLITSGCPSVDTNGRPISCYMKRSPHAFVRERGEQIERPLEERKQFEKNINTLYELLSHPDNADNVAAVMEHINKSRCLDFDYWRACGFYNAMDAGPLAKSYKGTIEDVCRMGNNEFNVWLCRTLTPPRSCKDLRYYFSDFWGCQDYSSSLLGAQLPHEALVAFAAARNDDNQLLVACLGQRWAREIRCHEPFKVNPLLKEMMEHSGGDGCDRNGLVELRDSMLHDELSFRVLQAARNEVEKLLVRGAASESINQILECIKIFSADISENVTSASDCWMLFSSDGLINLNWQLRCDYGNDHPLKKYSLFYKEFNERHPYNAMFIVLAIEGYEELIRWSLEPERSGWDALKEIQAVRIAAYLGHNQVLDLFLKSNHGLALLSTREERIEAALLGALEAGFVEEIEIRGLCPGSIQSDFSDFEQCLASNIEYNEKRDILRARLQSSLVGVAVFGCVVGHAGSKSGNDCGLDAKNVNALKWVERNTGAKLITFVRALVFLQATCLCHFEYVIFIDMYTHLIKLGLCPFDCQKETSIITNEIVSIYLLFQNHNVIVDDFRLRQWLALLVELGSNIQSIVGSAQEHDDRFWQVVRPLQTQQLRTWSNFDIVRNDGSLNEIQKAVASGVLDLKAYDANGLKLVHVAAAYDRVDILDWLVVANPFQLEVLDGTGRSVLEVAVASNATNVSLWISQRRAKQRVSVFVATSYRRRLALKEKQTRLRLLTALQALRRGYLVRRAFRDHLLSQLQEAQKFHAYWGRVLSLVDHGGVLADEVSWGAIKTKRFDLLDSLDESGEGDTVGEAVFSSEDHAETSRKIASATSVAIIVRQDESRQPVADDDNDYVGHFTSVSNVAGICSKSAAGFDRILLTRAVLRWRRQADPKYLEIFLDRIKQLAAGDRSLLLKKSLTGCKTIIYEAKLDAGQRILWTEEGGRGLIVWYVAKHDDVARLVRLMDKAESRTNRQLTTASNLPEIEEQLLASSETSGGGGSSEEVLLDPQGDTPLRLYDLRREDIDKLGESSTWQPPLNLTSKEREVVETEGTVLLLGRSGTGKTICICNRIDYDRHRAEGASSFKQLFVARSQRICAMVEDVVGKDLLGSCQTNFCTFKRLVADCEAELPASIKDNSYPAFLPSKRMDFTRFKRDVYQPGSTLDPLLVWTQIRSLIKSSIATFGRARSREEYMGLGKNECRLSQEQRDSCYSVFETYQRHMNDSNLWDDCDRITCLLRRLQSDPEARFAIAYDKLYVDEIQDYTQTEIAMFFLLCRHHGDLFLAGDPAQSVVEGSDFRNEDIRTVAHHLFQNEKTGKKGIPEKPLKLNVNFRSHSGILNVASGILGLLFSAFPGSAKELPRDNGLFLGPRPGVFMNVESSKLQELLSKIDGAFVLTHDEEMSRLKRCLGDYELILGIRESKGLEFTHVVLLDFFKGLSDEHQKPWRNLLQGRNEVDLKPGFPEIESHLKLLYTAVTRCSGRLFIAETGSSIAGQAFVRWATTGRGKERGQGDAVAVKQEVQDVEKMVRTPDEWRSNGVDFCMAAEGMDALEDSKRWFDKALYCFGQVGDTELARKARTNRSSMSFRQDLEGYLGKNEVDTSKIELDGAQMIERLLGDGLGLEARKVLDMLFPLLSAYSNEILREKLLPRLPALDDE